MNVLLDLTGPASTVVSRPAANDFTGVVEAIGTADLADRLLTFFAGFGGADHCAVFELRGFEFTEITAAEGADAAVVARSDLNVYEVKRQLSMVGNMGARVDVAMVPASDPMDPAAKRQRILICARRADAAYCIRVLRPAGAAALCDQGLGMLQQVANMLISVVSKHADLTLRRPNLTPALCSLEEIEDCMTAGTDLSKREGEVCARILYGLSSYGIALDLGIGKESVMTYRKRAYSRLGIGSQRELLMWYLAMWSKRQASRRPEEAAA